MIYFNTFREEDDHPTRDDKISIVSAYICLIILIVIPIYMSYFLYKIRNNLQDEKTLEEYEFIVTGANTENIYQASYNIIFCLRRYLIVLSLYAFRNKVQVQLCFNALIQLFYQMYICGCSPLLEKGDRRMEIFNECLIYVCIVAFFVFNDAKYTKL